MPRGRGRGQAQCPGAPGEHLPPDDVCGAVNANALVRALEAIGDFAWAERESLAELDVNPIVVREKGAGCVVVDALIVPRART